MPYSVVSVSLTDGQVKRLKSKSAKECGTTITLKPSRMTGGTHKISLTDRQIKHFNDALMKHRGVQIDFSKAAIANMIKSGGIFPLLAAIPALIAAAAPAVAKAAALGAVGTAAGMALKKATGGSARGSGYKRRVLFRMLAAIPSMSVAMAKAVTDAAAGKATGQGYKKKRKGSKITRDSTKLVQGEIRSRIGPKNTRNGLLMTEEYMTTLSNFDLIDAANALSLKNFRGVFMRDQLPRNPNSVETGIINLDNSSGPGTHWVAYAIDPRGIVYFDSYGLAPPKEFMRYVNEKSIPILYSTLPTQQLNDPPICGREVLNVLTEISRFPSKPPHLVVNEYTSGKLIN